MPPPTVCVTLPLPREHLAPLEEVAILRLPEPGVAAAARDWVMETIRDCVAVISQGELLVDSELLDAAPSLRMVANAAMGIDNLDLEALARRGIAASNTPDAFAESTADHTLALLLDVTRRVSESDRFIRTGDWERRGMEALRWEGSRLGGKTLGLVGYGRIARLVEKRATAFGMRVIHTRSRPSDHEGYRSLPALLAEVDAVAVLVPLTEKTRHLADAGFLCGMKPGSFFLNLARGKVMDEAAVAEALRSGHLAGAAFDVFEEEPRVHPALLAMDNVFLTPHIGGATREERRRGRLEAAENVARFLRGEPLLHPVAPPAHGAK